MQKKDLFKQSPLYKNRFEIVKEVRSQIQTGDLFFRLGGEKFLGFSFSQLTAHLTNSEWSHASIAIVRNGDVFLVEVNDEGTLEIRLIDWIDYCASGAFAVYRVKDLTIREIAKIRTACNKFLKQDPDYDFTFDDPNKYYCTESVIEILKRAGVTITQPKFAKELIGFWTYYAILIPNWVIGKIWKKSIPLSVPVYVVGNSQKGILSSERLEFVLRHDVDNTCSIAVLSYDEK